MSGLTPLVDTLLASRLAQRVDLVPLKSEVQIAGPGPISQVEEVVNDVRLSSRAAVEQQIGVGLLKSDQRGHDGMAASPGQTVSLSAAARAVSAILDGQTGTAARITGSEPLLASSQPLSASAIAAVLARTVNHSGLFYESHLAQFAAGAKSLADLVQEPQARLAGNHTAALLPSVALQPDGVVPNASGRPDVAISLPRVAAPDPAQSAPISDVAQAQKNAYASIQQADASAPAAKNHTENATNAVRGNAPLPAGIHPDAVALVRQQFELLAQPAFRWSGEAWPAAPMDWEIHQDEREFATGDEAVPQSWSTRLTLTLPTLGNIEVRISLAGNALQVRLAASEDTTLGLLREAGAELPAHLGELGLELTGLQINSLLASTDARTPKAGDGV